ncbi:MAG: hypothetical protein J0H80_15810, partial [Rhizobiales bacterium]|nr:hypothetical protein [Hyphomicrobiales bacterium]
LNHRVKNTLATVQAMQPR